jgi:two-component sensor histidine kinase/PAS domain-containing protein
MPPRFQFMAKTLSPQAFVMASLIMGVAIAMRWGLGAILPGTPPFITVFPAILPVGLLCGPVAASLAVVGGVAAALLLWLPYRPHLANAKLAATVSAGLFVMASAIIVWATARFRAELNRMSLARAALDLGQDVGGMGSFEYNLDTGRIDASGAAYRLHGMAEDTRETTSDDWLRGVDPSDMEGARESLRAAVEEGGKAAYSYRVADGAGGQRWISARGRVISSGGERRLVCALIDVTEQIKTQKALERERERLRLALEAGAMAVWEFHPDTDVSIIDARYAATMGFAPGLANTTRAEIGRSIHPDDRQRVAREHDAAIAAGGDYRIEFRVIDAMGQIRWVVSKGMMVSGDTPSSSTLVGVIQDMTDQKAREDRLREFAANREILIREADHRIKNSLQMVTSLLRMQLRGLEDTPVADALRGAIARVQAIAASHLALQASQDLQTVDLAFVLKELCSHFTAFHPDAAIDCDIEGPLPMDADRAIPLGLVVNELMTNALRHAFPEGRSGTVKLDALRDEDDIVVRVGDDGVGTARPSTNGGLGSKIIRSLAGQVGAQMETERAPDVGTAVTLRLPLRPGNLPAAHGEAR